MFIFVLKEPAPDSIAPPEAAPPYFHPCSSSFSEALGGSPPDAQDATKREGCEQGECRGKATGVHEVIFMLLALDTSNDSSGGGGESQRVAWRHGKQLL